MKNEQKLALMENRYLVLSNRADKNVKSPGTLKKLKRKIRNLKARMEQ